MWMIMMNKEVKFRGFRDKTEQWVYGCLVVREEPYMHDIIEPIGKTSSVTYAVRRGSEGQFTGLHDKNGKEIYEGDIIKAPHDFGPAGYHERIGLVQYDTILGYQWQYWLLDKLEVIGNVYQTPELLEGADQ